jgi:uncharacterized protein (TIGR03086 family)
MTDTRELHGRAVTEFASILDKVTDGQWTDRTPCSDWDVDTLVNHVTVGNHFFAGVSRGEQPSFEQLSKDLPSDRKVAFDESAKIVGEAFADDGVNDRMFQLPFGTLPAQAAIGIHFIDLVVHGWDLAKATGQQPVMPQDLVEQAWGIAKGFPDAPEMRGPGGPFGPKVEVPADAPVMDQLVGFLGRHP